MPHVRNWIRQHGDAWLNKLTEEYKITAVLAKHLEKTHVRMGDLVSLMYNPIEVNPTLETARRFVRDGKISLAETILGI